MDGTLVGETTTSGDAVDTGGLVIGGHRDGEGRNWEGLIDEVAVWDEVLSSSEISRLQTQQPSAAAVPEPSSVALMAVGTLIGLGTRLRKKRKPASST